MYRELKLKSIWEIIKKAVVSSAVVLLVVAGAGVFGLLLTQLRIPNHAADLILSIAKTRAMFWVLSTVLLLVVGCILDTIPAIMILTPIIVPSLSNYGIDPVAYGVIMVILLGIGLITPPVGLNLYVAAGLRKTKVETVINRHLFIYAGLAFAVTILLMVFPGIVTFLPRAAL